MVLNQIVNNMLTYRHVAYAMFILTALNVAGIYTLDPSAGFVIPLIAFIVFLVLDFRKAKPTK